MGRKIQGKEHKGVKDPLNRENDMQSDLCVKYVSFLNYFTWLGKKKLLFHSILKKSDKAKINYKSGKRNNLLLGETRQLEKQQNDVIAACRMLKIQRSAGVNNWGM